MKPVAIWTLLGGAALIAVFCLAVAYVALALWGSAAKDTFAVALIIAFLVSMIVNGVARLMRRRHSSAAREIAQ